MDGHRFVMKYECVDGVAVVRMRDCVAHSFPCIVRFGLLVSQEVVWDYVRCLENGEAISTTGKNSRYGWDAGDHATLFGTSIIDFHLSFCDVAAKFG